MDALRDFKVGVTPRPDVDSMYGLDPALVREKAMSRTSAFAAGLSRVFLPAAMSRQKTLIRQKQRRCILRHVVLPLESSVNGKGTSLGGL